MAWLGNSSWLGLGLESMRRSSRTRRGACTVSPFNVQSDKRDKSPGLSIFLTPWWQVRGCQILLNHVAVFVKWGLTQYLNRLRCNLRGRSAFFAKSLYLKRRSILPWLVWLSALSTGLRTKRSLVQFPVRAHAWVIGQVPGRGRMRGNHTLMFLSLSFSPPSRLSKSK